MQDIDVWHLVKSPKVLVHIIQKIVQALVLPLIQRPGKPWSRKDVVELFCSDCYIRFIANRFSLTRNLTCKGLHSGIQKIVVMKCFPCKENGVHLRRMSALKRVLLSSGRFRVFSVGIIQWSVTYSDCLVHAHNLCWRRVLEKTFDNCKICRFSRTRKGSFFLSFKFCLSIM